MDSGERLNASTILDADLDAGLADKAAIVWMGGAVSYGELFARACGAGRVLMDLGVRREERVLLVLDDSPTFVAAFLGAIRMGAIPVPVNPLLQHSEDYEYFFEDSLAAIVVVDESTSEKVSRAAQQASAKPLILAAADLVQADNGSLPPVPTRRDDMAFWLYSSGSTGRPKAVVHLQHDILYTCQTYAAQVLGIRRDDVTFSTTKLFHAYGLGNSLSFPIWAGATAALLNGRPTAQSVFNMIAEHRPTLFFSAPTMYNLLLNTQEMGDCDFSSIRHCVSAAESLPADVWRRWKERTGLTILDGIGSTEMLHIYCSNRLEDVRPGSSGKAVPGYEIKVINEEGQPVPPEQPGDMYVKGDSALALYWAQHEKSKAGINGHWFFTGDRYRQDADGYFWYEGRSDDMIKVSGLWVSPMEVESVLIEHPQVLESAVVGFQVDGLTRVKAYIILKHAQPSAELVADLQEHCKRRLQRFQYPHVIEFVSELPKTVTGKIQRYKLRQAGVD